MPRQPITLQFETASITGELDVVDTPDGSHYALYIGEADLQTVLDPGEVEQIKLVGATVPLPLGPNREEVPVALHVVGEPTN